MEKHMHIIATPHDIDATLHYFRQGIHIDAVCWRDWYVLKIATLEPQICMLSEQTTTVVGSILNSYDGAVMEPAQGVCLAFFHEPRSFDAQQLTNDLRRSLATTDNNLSINIFDVCANADVILTTLNSFLNKQPPPVTLTQPTEDTATGFTQTLQQFDEYEKFWERIINQRTKRLNPHIMLVDDDALTRCLVGQKLKRHYSLVTAQNASEAVRKHILFAPNVIFLDINLPDHSGFTLLNYFRQHDPQCHVVMFSGQHYFNNRLKAFAAGAEGFVSKPFHLQDFTRYIESWSTQKGHLHNLVKRVTS